MSKPIIIQGHSFDVMTFEGVAYAQIVMHFVAKSEGKNMLYEFLENVPGRSYGDGVLGKWEKALRIGKPGKTSVFDNNKLDADGLSTGEHCSTKLTIVSRAQGTFVVQLVIGSESEPVILKISFDGNPSDFLSQRTIFGRLKYSVQKPHRSHHHHHGGHQQGGYGYGYGGYQQGGYGYGGYGHGGSHHHHHHHGHHSK